jgi:hypothetical protein
MHLLSAEVDIEKEDTTVNTFSKVKTVMAGSIIALATMGAAPVFAAPADEVQAPRAQDVQAPRAQDVQAPRSQDDVQAPRSQDDVQAPRSDEVQAPRVQPR